MRVLSISRTRACWTVMNSVRKLSHAHRRTQTAISNHLCELVDVTNSLALNSEEIAEGIFNGIVNNHRYLQNEFWIAMGKSLISI